MTTKEEAIQLVKEIMEPYDIDDLNLQHSILALSITNSEAADQIMQRARKDAFQYRVAIAWIESTLKAKKPLPCGAVTLVSDVLTGQLKPPKQKGQHKVENIGRNHRICVAIELLIERGYKPTRNDASEASSACDVVAETLWPGAEDKYQTVKSVWLNKGSHTIKPAFEAD